MRARLARAAGGVASLLGRTLRNLPGVAAIGCGVAGAAVLWGTGVALLVAAGFLLAIDRST